MSTFDQRYQQVGTQYNAEQITINIGASTPAPRPALLWQVPYRRNPLFTGREDILHRLHDALTASKHAALTQAISGLGGIGKTQTALEYAYRYHQEYEAILWVRARSREELVADLAQLAYLLQLPEQHEQEQQQVLAAVLHWFMSHTGWLLIVDNADDLAMVQGVLPTHAEGHLLLTTRAQAVRSLARKIELSTLPPEESVRFLLRRAGLLERDEEDSLSTLAAPMHASAEAIASTLGYLPLALDQAGAYLEETGNSLSDYLTLYQKERKTLLARRGGLEEMHGPVATTWSLAFTALAVKHPAAIDVMRLCTFLSPDAIAEELLLQGAGLISEAVEQAASSPLAWSSLLGELGRYSLLRREPETHTLSLHRLVQAVIYDEMGTDMRRRWSTIALLVVLVAFPFHEVAPWTKSQRYINDVLTCLEHADQLQIEGEAVNALRHNVAAYYYDRGQYSLAQALIEQVLRSREQLLGSEHPNTLLTRGALALLYYNRGKYEQAQALYEQVLCSQEQLQGSEHPHTLLTRQNLAILYADQGKVEQAQTLFEQVLRSFEQQLGSEHPDTLSTRQNLALLYKKQGKKRPLIQTIVGKLKGRLHQD